MWLLPQRVERSPSLTLAGAHPTFSELEPTAAADADIRGMGGVTNTSPVAFEEPSGVVAVRVYTPGRTGVNEEETAVISPSSETIAHAASSMHRSSRYWSTVYMARLRGVPVSTIAGRPSIRADCATGRSLTVKCISELISPLLSCSANDVPRTALPLIVIFEPLSVAGAPEESVMTMSAPSTPAPYWSRRRAAISEEAPGGRMLPSADTASSAAG